MWVVTFFDLPTETKEHKKAYRHFHNFLLSDGYVMLQFSVYARACPTFEAAEKHSTRVESKLPEEGQVRILQLTALQYARMKCFFGKNVGETEREPLQLAFF